MDGRLHPNKVIVQIFSFFLPHGKKTPEHLRSVLKSKTPNPKENNSYLSALQLHFQNK
jgi:hypothetical protein